jgi:sigma-B regulation protein RsbU (phosphoserine phosphatase)
MKTKLFDEVQTHLEETRSNLIHWIEAAPEEEQQTCLASQDGTCVKEHLHVIDETLEKIKEGTFGICKLCQDAVESQLLQMDYTSDVCLGHFSDEELRQLENELEMSQIVQRGLLPWEIPFVEGMNIAALSRPAQIVGGDYFDFLNFKDGTHGFVMADVSGHGVSAGMFMSSLQTAFHTLVPEADSPLSVLERINRLYMHNIHVTTFVTIFLAKYDPQTRIMSYTNAGHNSAYLYHGMTGEEDWLRPTGPAIGLVERFSINCENIQLQPGDILLLYTDGITEAADFQGSLWGKDRLADIIRQNADASSEQLIQMVMSALKEYTNGSPLADDVTLIISKLRQ